MTILDKLNSYCPTEESEVPIQFTQDEFEVTELFSAGIYSLIVMYRGNIIFQRATFRRVGCRKYRNKRLKYIAGLEDELKKLSLIY